MDDAPTRTTHPARRRRTVVLLAAAGLLVAGASCSSGGDESLPPGLTVLDAQPGRDGDVCVDQAGDLEAPDGSTVTEPAGIDLTRAEAAVRDGNVHVVLETAGPVDGATNPLFVVQQGDVSTNLDVSFEVHLEPSDGTWKASLVHFRNGRQVVPSPNVPGRITAEGNRVVADLPVGGLPPIATSVWQFGSSSGVGQRARVIDLCQPFATPTPGTSGPGTTQAGPTTTVDRNTTVAVGQTATAPDGTKVTVRQVQDPAVPNRAVTATTAPGNRLVAVEAEVCAGDGGAEDVGDVRFSLQSASGRGLAPWMAPDHTNDPQFPAGITLRPGACTDGWITYEVLVDDPSASVIYDTSGVGSGPFLVFTR